MLFVRLIVKHPTGSAKLEAEDLAIEGFDAEVIRLGSKRIVPKRWTDTFHSHTVRGRQVVEGFTHTSPSAEATHGGLWRAVAVTAIEPLEAAVAEVRVRFEADRDAFLSDLDALADEQRSAWQGAVRDVAEARAARGESLDVAGLVERMGAAYDVAFERFRQKLEFTWGLVYLDISAPDVNGQAETLTSDALRRSLTEAKASFDRQMDEVRHEITQSIRARVLERLEAVSRKVEALRDGGGTLMPSVLRGLARELETARITNPFGPDANLQAAVKKFEQDWLEGRSATDVAASVRTDGTLALRLQASIDRMIGHTQTVIEEASQAHALNVQGAAAAAGKRRIRK